MKVFGKNNEIKLKVKGRFNMEYNAPLCLKCPMFVSTPKAIGGKAICKAYPKGIPQRIYFQAANCTKKPSKSRGKNGTRKK